MNKIKSYLLVVTFFLLLAVACKNKTASNDGALIGYDYYPIQVGAYYIYDVTINTYQGLFVAGTYTPITKDTTFQMKELVVEPITVADETRYQLYRFYKTTDGTWKDQPDSVWTVFNNNSLLIKVEDNVRYIKLSFPLVNGKRWNGNQMNPKDTNFYTMVNFGKPFSFDNSYYPTTATVVQKSGKDFTKSDNRQEVYAEGVGLIYKSLESYTYLYSQPGYQNIVATDSYIIYLGQKYVQKLVSHGQN